MQVDVLALVISAVVYFFLGAAWYGKFMFGNVWMKAMNFSPEMLHKHQEQNGNSSTVKGMIFSLIGAFLTAFSLMQFFIYGAGDIVSNIRFAGMAWLGFIAASQMGAVYFNNFDKQPGKLFFINTGYNLVGFMLIAVIQASL